jgi:hypothetical protein
LALRIRQLGIAAFLGAMLLMNQAANGQSCPPCGDYESVVEKRRQLEEAFSLSLTVPDCLGVSNLNTCRKIEEILEDVTQAIDFILTRNIPEGESKCLSCDPRPNLISLTHGLNSLTYFLLDNGYGDPSSSHENRLAALKTWRGYRCPCSASPEETAATVTDPEVSARDELTRKCGPNFTKRRKGLRQVLRVPNDHPGCYQSRKCRAAMAYKGFDAEPGFWSYDGEYWYIWAERLGTAGEWVECLPETEDP